MPEPLHRLIQSHDLHIKIHGSGKLAQFNTRLAVFITRSVGSMWCAYLFVLIAFVSLPAALSAFLSGDTVVGVSWLSQSMIQLVLLPVILVGQQIISATQDARAETDHETLNMLQQINMNQLAILQELQQRH